MNQKKRASKVSKGGSIRPGDFIAKMIHHFNAHTLSSSFSTNLTEFEHLFCNRTLFEGINKKMRDPPSGSSITVLKPSGIWGAGIARVAHMIRRKRYGRFMAPRAFEGYKPDQFYANKRVFF